MLKITAAGGHSNYVKITDAATGEDVGKALALKAMDISIHGGKVIEATAQILILEPDLECEKFDWSTKHPVSGTFAPLAALDFRDGTRVTFREDGAPIIQPPAPAGEPQTVTLKLDFDARHFLLSAAHSMFGEDVPAPGDDVTAEEMSEAIAFHLRLKETAVSPELAVDLGADAGELKNADGEPVPVKEAGFWNVLRPATITDDLGGVFSALERDWKAPAAPTGPADRAVTIRASVEGFSADTTPGPDGACVGLLPTTLDKALDFASEYLGAGQVTGEVVSEAASTSI